jgi:hypothetical protein
MESLKLLASVKLILSRPIFEKKLASSFFLGYRMSAWDLSKALSLHRSNRYSATRILANSMYSSTSYLLSILEDSVYLSG